MVAAVVLEVVAAVVAVVVAALVVLAVVEELEDDEAEWPPIIRSSLWHPPKVSISAAAQARTEKRIGTPIGSKARATAAGA